MKAWFLIFSVVLSVVLLSSINIGMSKQKFSTGARVIDQETGLTAGDQSNKPIDILITKRIREELMKDSGLSAKAKNIAIITLNKGVTLKGAVESAEQREKILEHAYISAPKYKIYNQISVIK
jgi:osmotically-inducible protein OsmY